MAFTKPIPKVPFGSKAETLKSIKPFLQKGVIDELLVFSVKDWKNNASEIYKKISDQFQNRVIIRSSALNEDCFSSSNAGHFTSVSNLDPNDFEQLKNGINLVVASYSDMREDHQFFVQKFLSNVEISGVIFTRDINTFAPYITVNYDDQSGRTDTVTSGGKQPTKTCVIFKEKVFDLSDRRMDCLLEVIQELEQIFGNDALDIEFAIVKNEVHILQVRPIVKKEDIVSVPDTTLIRSTLQQIHQRLEELNTSHPDLYGSETLYGIMPDWNPAEMIGIKPRPLALSLYRELITDSVWAYQRDNYGYKRLRSFPLLISLAGHPYIDVRVDFNSFLPKSLDETVSHKLADFYLQKLKSDPTSHDKVEFDIVYTCYTFDLDKKLEELKEHSFQNKEISEIKNALRDLTKKIIGTNGHPGLYEEDLNRIRTLESRREKLLATPLSEVNKIYWLIEDCKRYGTLPFAGIARAGFIAIIFLNSLVDLKILTAEEKNKFLNSLQTITKQLSQDIRKLQNETLSRTAFLKEYGHLRPGTYDICLESYAENFEKYFNFTESSRDVASSEDVQKVLFELRPDQEQVLVELLNEHQLDITPVQLFQFMKSAIEGREYAKFSFTKSVSEILSMIKQYGNKFGLSSEDMSYVEVGTIIKFYSTVAYFDEREVLIQEIQRNRSISNFYKYLRLPHLICEPQDLFFFHLDEVEPNYITLKTVEGEPLIINPFIQKDSLFNKIVFIESADPGFDWIFSHNIKGLVTMYGGANSHMAIRAAELNIPAIIGCGPLLFDQWSGAKTLRIDTATKRVIVIS